MCYNCGKNGHIAKNCWHQSTKYCSSTEPDDEEKISMEETLGTLREVEQETSSDWKVVTNKRKKHALQAVEHKEESKMVELEMAVDSGATENVIPANVVTHVPLSSDMNKNKMKYEVAN